MYKKFYIFFGKLYFVYNFSLWNEEVESFEKYKKEFTENFSNLNKRMEDVKKMLEILKDEGVVNAHYKNKEACYNEVSTRKN